MRGLISLVLFGVLLVQLTSAITRDELKENVAGVFVDLLNTTLQSYKKVYEELIEAGKDSSWKSKLDKFTYIVQSINELSSSEKKSEYVLKLYARYKGVANIYRFYNVNPRLTDDDVIVAEKLKEFGMHKVMLDSFRSFETTSGHAKKLVGDYLDLLSAEEKHKEHKLVDWYEGLTQRTNIDVYMKFFDF